MTKAAPTSSEIWNFVENLSDGKPEDNLRTLREMLAEASDSDRPLRELHQHLVVEEGYPMSDTEEFSGRIEKFVVVDENNREGDQEFDTWGAAAAAAGRDNAVFRRIYDFQDSELAWTPDGSNDWPPRPPAPPGHSGTIGDLYFAVDGRWWEKTDETTWTSRGEISADMRKDLPR